MPPTKSKLELPMAGPIRSDGYDYDGDWEAYYYDFFHNPEDKPSEEERLLLEEETEYESKLYHELNLAEREKEQYNEWAQANEPLNYDHDTDPCGYYDIHDDTVCPNCFTDVNDTYRVSTTHSVCECSPLYPDLRPDDFRSDSSCSCNVAQYEFLGMSVCSCTSPDLHALLERKYILFHGHKPEPPNQPSIDDHPF